MSGVLDFVRVRRVVLLVGLVLGAALLAPAAGQAGSPATTLSWSPSGTYDYGTVVNGQSATQTFTLTDTKGKVSGLNVSLANSSGSAFAITNDGCSGKSVDPAHPCTVTVQYAPTAVESDSATLTATNKQAKGSTSLTLTGSGQAATALTSTPGTNVVLDSGSKLSDSATLSGGSTPSGTIIFYLFAPGVTPDGSDSNNIYSDTVTVNGNGTYSTATGTNPGGYLPTVMGTYQWLTIYSGDSANSGSQTTFGDEPQTSSALHTTTLASAANSGDTNVKVASVTTLGTTLAAAANSGATNIKVTSAAPFYATTLAAAAGAGDTNIKVANTSVLRAGQTINIDSGGNVESATIAAGGVGSAGATGTGVTLTAPLSNAHAAGVPVTPAGQMIHVDTGASEENATIQAVGTAGATGTGITLTAPLADAHASGAQVDVATMSIDTGAAQETVTLTNVGTPGSNGTGVDFTAALSSAHQTGTLVIPQQP